MQLNENGLALLRAFEGFRAQSYRDVAGVWTIGYGHTGRAGPPEVTPHSRMTEPEARALMKQQAEIFARAVRSMLTRELTDDQFSALVSFAFNVGETNFRRSSVLKAVNAGDDAAVARRLGLWVKAGGKVWPGLVRRRAAEAALYLSRVEGPRAPLDVPRGKPMRHSTTSLAAGVSAAAGTAAALAGSLRQIADALSGPYVTVVLLVGILLAFGWILRERWLKSVDEGV
jgi:lysozyme